MVGATRCQIWSCRADKARACATNALKSAPRMEPLLQAGVYALWPYSGAILLRLRLAAIENNHARIVPAPDGRVWRRVARVS